jgi:hypothetical protein
MPEVEHVGLGTTIVGSREVGVGLRMELEGLSPDGGVTATYT